MKCRAAFHFDRVTRVMREDERRNVIRRFVAPPAFPIFIWPWPTNRAEHISPEYPRAFAAHALGRKAIVNARLTAFIAMLFDEGLCRKEPLHQLRPANTERVFETLIRSRGKTV